MCCLYCWSLFVFSCPCWCMFSRLSKPRKLAYLALVTTCMCVLRRDAMHKPKSKVRSAFTCSHAQLSKKGLFENSEATSFTGCPRLGASGLSPQPYLLHAGSLHLPFEPALEAEAGASFFSGAFLANLRLNASPSITLDFEAKTLLA